MGGIAISEAAERVPERIKGLVYVAAMLVPKGRSLQECAGESGTNESLVLSPDARFMRCDPAFASAVFYNRTDPDRAKDAVSRLRLQLLLPATEPLTVSQARFGSVCRAYIECLDDHAIPIALQRRMQAELPCDPVVTLDADHSPFLSMPGSLAAALLNIAERFADR
jgi:pimeloyl-ACP methyl ester carboxylesterase